MYICKVKPCVTNTLGPFTNNDNNLIRVRNSIFKTQKYLLTTITIRILRKTDIHNIHCNDNKIDILASVWIMANFYQSMEAASFFFMEAGKATTKRKSGNTETTNI